MSRPKLEGGARRGAGRAVDRRAFWHIPSAYNVLASGSAEQVDRWLRPALRGELHGAYAVTEEQTGSDPSGIRARARRGVKP